MEVCLVDALNAAVERKNVQLKPVTRVLMLILLEYP